MLGLTVHNYRNVTCNLLLGYFNFFFKKKKFEGAKYNYFGFKFENIMNI